MWKDGLITIHGLYISRAHPYKKKIASEFINDCVDAKRQAIFPKYTASGVTNLQAYQLYHARACQELRPHPRT